MTQIYADLCACCDQPKTQCHTAHLESGSISLSQAPLNHFACLSLEDDPKDADNQFSKAFMSCSECDAEVSPSCTGTASGVLLAEDDLGISIGVGMIMQQMRNTFDEVNVCWERVGLGDASFVAASLVTDTAMATLRDLERQLRDLDEHLDLQSLQKTCSMLHGNADDDTPAGWHDLAQKLSATKKALIRSTGGHILPLGAADVKSGRKPVGCVRPTELHRSGGKSDFLTTLIGDIQGLVFSESTPGAVVRSITPVYADMGHFLSNRDDKSAELRLLLSLTLLSKTYTAYLDNVRPPATIIQSRLIALSLAQQGRQTIHDLLSDRACFPCRCTQTLAFHLQNLEADLLHYASHKCWDVFFQSPWVAGNHALEMLDLCHYYGVKLFGYRHYVGAVLHTYNVLQQLAGLEEVPLFEGLCEQYEQRFFPGGRPKGNFKACWTRYIGARLKFKKGHRSRNQRDSWCMAIPAHAAQKAAGLGITKEQHDEKDECLLFKIKQQDYCVSADQWATIRHAETLGKSEEAHAVPSRLQSLFSYANSLVSSSSYEAIPQARLNHFAVFATCVRIISTLSDAAHTGKEDKGMNCICFVSAVLSGGDRIVEARKMGRTSGACWTQAEREGVVKMTVDAFEEVVGARPVAEWLWNL